MQCATVGIEQHVPAFGFHKRNRNSASASQEVVYIVDHDPSMRESLANLLAALGRYSVAFSSAEDYLEADRTDSTACLILDLQLPDMNGLDLQHRLAKEYGPPVIFLSSYADVRSIVRAMKAGAVEFLTKPVSQTLLEAAIDSALALDHKRRHQRRELESLRERFTLLTPREREVLPLVTHGLLNKQAAAMLGIKEVTLQVHRGQIMRKLAARSFAELVRMAEKLGLSSS